MMETSAVVATVGGLVVIWGGLAATIALALRRGRERRD
jgi:hypothetical protein